MNPILLQPPRERDGPTFLAATAASRELHAPWVTPPLDTQGYTALLLRSRHRDHAVYLAWWGEDLVGLVSCNDMVRGNLASAFLGYYGFAPFTGRGLMRAALARAVTAAFGPHGLHRLEANIQPDNTRSRALVERLGFRREGFSPRYLRVGGEWRDHERWALLADEWAPAAAARPSRPAERGLTPPAAASRREVPPAWTAARSPG